jgi:hypothetical protein
LWEFPEKYKIVLRESLKHLTSKQQMNNSSILLCCYFFVLTTFAFGQSSSTVTFPLKASADNRYLVDQKVNPFPILGRTAWFMISQSVTDYKYFLDNTLAKGYNSIEMSMITHDPRGSHPPFNGDNDLPFLKQLNGSPWNGSLVYKDIETEAPDLTTPNEKYWKYLDEFLRIVNQKEFLFSLFRRTSGTWGLIRDGWKN